MGKMSIHNKKEAVNTSKDMKKNKREGQETITVLKFNKNYQNKNSWMMKRKMKINNSITVLWRTASHKR